MDCTDAVCGDGLTNTVAGEDCDDSGESATCDIDCTDVSCGDGVHNASAGEGCDDAGESPTCDPDCTPAVCGDTYVNVSASEDCDDGAVDTATCDADCTVAECGDFTVNAVAGEDCDDGAVDTATCDDDCTTAECGDLKINTVAGEECELPGGPGSELCYDGIDNDGDLLIDCQDDFACPAVCDFDGVTPCLTHRDCKASVPFSQCLGLISCTPTCLRAAPCSNVTRDPSRIIFAKDETELDFIYVHATFTNQLDRRADGEPFHIVLSNENGVILSEHLDVGDLVGNKNGTRYKFRNKPPGRGGSSTPGVAVVKLRKKKFEGRPSYAFKIKAYGDLSAATVPQMTTQVGMAKEVAVIRGEWTKTGKGWKLFDRDVE